MACGQCRQQSASTTWKSGLKPVRLPKLASLAVLLPAAALISAGPSLASESGGHPEPHEGTKPTVVLVHGASLIS
ncbi:hypothetical protein GCM10010515_70240 [Streptomyces fructofermentans]|uniref:Alpha/beta hydrolase n=1 Tax=Streptomyces fructofermentans TaxID=152141 RepID=A0A918NSU4_9ACTN|nr:hypothetical protein GCM10010515_70240 [Streptomyces fructofermentans]